MSPRRPDRDTVVPESSGSVKSGAESPISSAKRPSVRRAVGVVRVSGVGARDGERFVSPSEQGQRIVAACDRDGLDLVDVIDETDVSGGTPVAARDGLRHAVGLVETVGQRQTPTCSTPLA